MVLFEKQYLTIEIDRNTGCLVQRWIDFSTSEQFREGLMKALEIFRQEQVTRMICDTKDQAIVKKEDSDYATELLKEFVKSGLTTCAFVVPASIFAKISVQSFIRSSESMVNIQYFDQMKKAKEWMKAE